MTAAVDQALGQYGVAVTGSEQLGRYLWRVSTDSGYLALRAIPRSGRKAAASLAALELLAGAKVPQVPEWRRAPQGQLGIRHDHHTWLLGDWIDGHGATLGLVSDATIAARDLASLHLAAVGLADWGHEGDGPYLRYLARSRSRLKAVQTYTLIAENRLRRTATDRVFLSLMGDAADQASQSIKGLEDGGFRQLAASQAQAKAFVYRNVGEGGVVITAGASPAAVFVDWSGCRRDCQITDVVKLLTRVVKGSGGDQAAFGQALEAYQSVRPLSQAEQAVLVAMLRFPDEFCAVARRYYENKRDWPERSFARRLRRAVDRSAALAACAATATGVIGE